VLLDTQFITSHLLRFGAIEIPRGQYLKLLEDALGRQAAWPDTPGGLN
jgi:leucyl/phenylalanyl-tRNA--protein transferase